MTELVDKSKGLKLHTVDGGGEILLTTEYRQTYITEADAQLMVAAFREAFPALAEVTK